MPVVARMIADHYGARSSFPARPSKNIFFARTRRNWQARAAYSAGVIKPPSPPYKAILKQRCVRSTAIGGGLTMHDQRHLTQDAVRRAQIAMVNRLIVQQSAAIARAHSAIERAMETLRGPKSASDGGGDRAAEYSARCRP